MGLGTCPRQGVLLISALCAALLMSAMCGCGGAPAGGYPVVPVSGKVTWDDGTIIANPEMRLEFLPQVERIDKKTYPRNGTATIDAADGTFTSATTDASGDGLIVGKHLVKLTAFLADGSEERLAVSPAEIEVGSGSTEFTFTVKKEED